MAKSLNALKDEEREALTLDSNLLARFLNLNFNLTVPELHEKIRAMRCSGIEAAIISVLLKAIETGDHARLDFLLTRILGKVKTEVSIDLTTRFDRMTTDELLEHKRKLDVVNTRTLGKLIEADERFAQGSVVPIG